MSSVPAGLVTRSSMRCRPSDVYDRRRYLRVQFEGDAAVASPDTKRLQQARTNSAPLSSELLVPEAAAPLFRPLPPLSFRFIPGN